MRRCRWDPRPGYVGGVRGVRASPRPLPPASSPSSSGLPVTHFPSDSLGSFGQQQRLVEEPRGGERARPGCFSFLFVSGALLRGCTLGCMLASPSGVAADAEQLCHGAESPRLRPSRPHPFPTLSRSPGMNVSSAPSASSASPSALTILRAKFPRFGQF